MNYYILIKTQYFHLDIRSASSYIYDQYRRLINFFFGFEQLEFSKASYRSLESVFSAIAPNNPNTISQKIRYYSMCTFAINTKSKPQKQIQLNPIQIVYDPIILLQHTLSYNFGKSTQISYDFTQKECAFLYAILIFSVFLVLHIFVRISTPLSGSYTIICWNDCLLLRYLSMISAYTLEKSNIFRAELIANIGMHSKYLFKIQMEFLSSY